ncbi:MAG: translational GTPase TypA, partial [Ilumatobacteraceae bacterium]
VDTIAAGDLFIVAGIDEVEVGDTLASVDAPSALARLEVDEPVLRMSFAVNSSPFSGREGTYVTSRHLHDRLKKEILGNVSIKLFPTDSPDVIEVAGRGELQLAVLIENMRREGYELQVSRPEVITKEIDGKKHEPYERGTIDVPDEFVGAVTQAIAPRRGRIVDMRPGDAGRTIMHFTAPSRGLIGFRSLLLTVTRGTALVHQSFAGFEPWAGDVPHRLGGAMIADRIGPVTAYALDNLQMRGTLFVEPGDEVYEGMVVGECARGEEMVVNAVRAKEKNNIRTHSHDDGVKLAAPVIHTLETAIEWIGDDELVEVTPKSIRIRKRWLGLEDRRRANKKG